MKGPQIESDMPSALGLVTRQVDGNKRTDMHYDYDQHVHSNSKGRQVVDCIYCRVTTQTTKSRAALLSYDLALIWTSRKWLKICLQSIIHLKVGCSSDIDEEKGPKLELQLLSRVTWRLLARVCSELHSSDEQPGRCQDEPSTSFFWNQQLDKRSSGDIEDFMKTFQ